MQHWAKYWQFEAQNKMKTALEIEHNIWEELGPDKILIWISYYWFLRQKKELFAVNQNIHYQRSQLPSHMHHCCDMARKEKWKVIIVKNPIEDDIKCYQSRPFKLFSSIFFHRCSCLFFVIIFEEIRYASLQLSRRQPVFLLSLIQLSTFVLDGRGE